MMQFLSRIATITLTYFLYRITGWGIRNQEKTTEVLSKVYSDDQRTRSKNMDERGLKEMKFFDKLNMIKVTSIIQKYNWPDDSFIDVDGSKAIFLTILHADLRNHKYFLPLIRKAGGCVKIKPSSVAYLEDRIAIQEGKPQIFGTQIGRENDSSEYFVFPVQDQELIDIRRKSVGLQPMAEYVKFWNITW